jgi:hypothetical protein
MRTVHLRDVVMLILQGQVQWFLSYKGSFEEPILKKDVTCAVPILVECPPLSHPRDSSYTTNGRQLFRSATTINTQLLFHVQPNHIFYLSVISVNLAQEILKNIRYGTLPTQVRIRGYGTVLYLTTVLVFWVKFFSVVPDPQTSHPE